MARSLSGAPLSALRTGIISSHLWQVPDNKSNGVKEISLSKPTNYCGNQIHFKQLKKKKKGGRRGHKQLPSGAFTVLSKLRPPRTPISVFWIANYFSKSLSVYPWNSTCQHLINICGKREFFFFFFFKSSKRLDLLRRIAGTHRRVSFNYHLAEADFRFKSASKNLWQAGNQGLVPNEISCWFFSPFFLFFFWRLWSGSV